LGGHIRGLARNDNRGGEWVGSGENTVGGERKYSDRSSNNTVGDGTNNGGGEKMLNMRGLTGVVARKNRWGVRRRKWRKIAD